LDIFKRVIVFIVRVLFKAKYETSVSGFNKKYIFYIFFISKSLTLC